MVLSLASSSLCSFHYLYCPVLEEKKPQKRTRKYTITGQTVSNGVNTNTPRSNNKG